MGVDLYVGPLARYYALDWETPTQTFARLNNLALETVHANPQTILTGAEGGAAVLAFRDRVQEKLGARAAWALSPVGAYEAHQLTREGLDALVLTAAHRSRPDLTLPLELPQDIQAHPAVSEASARNYYIGPMAVFEAQMVVPGLEGRICGDKDCRGNPVIVVTTAALASAIDDMLDYLEVERDTLAAILAEGPPPLNAETMRMQDGRWVAIPAELPKHPVRAHALWGLACFNACLAFAEQTGGAIVRDE